VIGKVHHGRNLRVVDDLDVASRIDDLGRGEANLLDRAAEIIHHHDIAHLVFVLEDDVESGDDIADERLGPEADDEGNSDRGRFAGCPPRQIEQDPIRGGQASPRYRRKASSP
jgi:hypothetical protein